MGILTQEQANFILSSRLRKQTPNVVRDFSRDDGYEAFKELRWGWTGGKPMCPHCFHERLYEFADRDKFKCAKCGRQFSTTTATSFKSRKMEHKTYIHAMSVKLHEPSTIMELGQKLSINYRTAWRLNQLMSLIRGNVRVRTGDRVWPYANPSPNESGADIMALVNSKVRKSIPETLRADICQEIILGVLEGEITLNDVIKQTDIYVRKFWVKHDWKYKTVSLDQQMFSGRSWHDVIEDRHARMDGEDDDEDFLGFEPLDADEYGFSSQEEKELFYTEKRFTRRPEVGGDRIETLRGTVGMQTRPVLNMGRVGR